MSVITPGSHCRSSPDGLPRCRTLHRGPAPSNSTDYSNLRSGEIRPPQAGHPHTTTGRAPPAATTLAVPVNGLDPWMEDSRASRPVDGGFGHQLVVRAECWSDILVADAGPPDS